MKLHPPKLPPLTAAPLSSTILAAQEEELDLKGYFFSEEEGRYLVFSGDSVGCRFDHCTFTQCDFSRASFVDCQFSHCDFSNCPMEGAIFQRVTLCHCKGVGTQLTQSHLFHTQLEQC